MKFVLWNKFWWEYDESTPLNNATLYNRAGGKNSYNDITNCKMSEAKDYEHLDWHNTSVWDNSYKTGWLAPDGTFYGCENRMHITQCKMVHHVTEGELENKGFVKIFLSMNRNLVAVFLQSRNTKNYPTTIQLDYLKLKTNCDYSDVAAWYKLKLFEQKKNKEKDSKEEDSKGL